jgi:hypothetical protein
MRYRISLLAAVLVLSIPLSGSALIICSGACPEAPPPTDLLRVEAPDTSFLLADAQPLSISLSGGGLGGLFQMFFSSLLNFQGGGGPPGSGLSLNTPPLFNVLRNFTLFLRERGNDPGPAVPEPATAVQLSLGLGALAVARRLARRRSAI